MRKNKLFLGIFAIKNSLQLAKEIQSDEKL